MTRRPPATSPPGAGCAASSSSTAGRPARPPTGCGAALTGRRRAKIGAMSVQITDMRISETGIEGLRLHPEAGQRRARHGPGVLPGLGARQPAGGRRTGARSTSPSPATARSGTARRGHHQAGRLRGRGGVRRLPRRPAGIGQLRQAGHRRAVPRHPGAGAGRGVQRLPVGQPEGSQYLYCFTEEWRPGMAGTAYSPLDEGSGIGWPIPVDPATRPDLGQGRGRPEVQRTVSEQIVRANDVRADRLPAAVRAGDLRRDRAGDRGLPRPDAPPRSGRRRHLVRRRGGDRLPPAVADRLGAQPPAAALPGRPLPPHLQRRDLQLPGAARAAAERVRRRVRDPGRRRGDRGRLPLPRREDRRAAARHVRVPDLGQPGAGAVRRPGLVRHQAALHLHRRARLVLRLGEEGAALGRRRPVAQR